MPSRRCWRRHSILSKPNENVCVCVRFLSVDEKVCAQMEFCCSFAPFNHNTLAFPQLAHIFATRLNCWAKLCSSSRFSFWLLSVPYTYRTAHNARRINTNFVCENGKLWIVDIFVSINFGWRFVRNIFSLNFRHSSDWFCNFLLFDFVQPGLISSNDCVVRFEWSKWNVNNGFAIAIQLEECFVKIKLIENDK